MTADLPQGAPEDATEDAQGKNKKGWSLTGVIIGFCIFAAGAILLCFNIYAAAQQSGAVSARVVGYSKSQVCFNHQGCHEIYPPKVSFTTSDDTHVTATVSGLRPSSPAPDGTMMKVSYVVSDPSVVRTAGFDWWGTWGWQSLLVLVGGFVAWACLPSRRRRSE